MIVSSFSAGVSSFIATYLMKDRIDKIIYIHVEDQHSDSLRFVKDAEKVLQKPIEVLQSRYINVANVCRQFGFINSPRGAKCTEILKRRVNKEWLSKQTADSIEYVWGLDCTPTEKSRACNIRESHSDMEHHFPLIDKGIDKHTAHGICNRLGIKRPMMYDLGYSNNNCLGCLKGGMGYWNKIRIDFPYVFNSRAKLEREIGARCLKQCFLDELDPMRGRDQHEIMTDCSEMCEVISKEEEGII